MGGDSKRILKYLSEINGKIINEVVLMCGRFTLTSDMDLLLYRFAIGMPVDFDYLPRYNIAPTQTILGIVNEDDQSRFKLFKWGLIPFWAKDTKFGAKMINARCETLAEKPSFKHLIKRRRCLIPADGFYEWIQTETPKQPVYIRLKSSQPFAFAGLWDEWQSSSEVIQSCTIITTEANSLIQPVHNRMPVILRPEQEQLWLDPELQNYDELSKLFKPYPSEEMEMYPVSRLVNSPRNESPKCLEPLGL